MITINNTEINFTQFPNGETFLEAMQINKACLWAQDCTIKFKYENDSDLIKLMFVKKHLDDLNKITSLIIYYMPYSRMDRTEGKTVFTLKYVAEFINSLNFESVTICEPHSDVAPALINKCRIKNTSAELVVRVIQELDFDSNKNDYLFYPDAGAEKRYSKQINYEKVLSASKERDFETGFIKKLAITGELPSEPFRAIIVDDLCSRGGTFMLSAQKLKEAGATEIYLVVTHCEDSIHDGDILKTDLIKEVYTTKSILTKTEHEKIKIFSL